MPKLKIGINGRFLNKPYTGIGNYLNNLLEAMLHERPDLELIVVSNEPVKEATKWKAYDNLQLVVLPELRILKWISAGLAKSYWEYFQLKRVWRKQRVEVIHHPYPCLFQLFCKPTIVTVHDIIPWQRRDYGRASLLGGLYNWVIRLNLKVADLVLTVSESTAKDLKKMQFKQVFVAPNASVFNGKKVKQAEKTLNKYGIKPKDKFIFYLGGFDKRKNVPRLVRIFEKYLEPRGYKLVLGGGKVLATKFYADFDQKFGKSVIRTGPISTQDLPAFYQSTEAFVHLSQAEGFNIPILDALVNGCRVVASDLEVHREITGGSATLLNLKFSDKKIAEKIMIALKSEPQKFKNPYSWKRSAKMVTDQYQKIIISLWSSQSG